LASNWLNPFLLFGAGHSSRAWLFFGDQWC